MRELDKRERNDGVACGVGKDSILAVYHQLSFKHLLTLLQNSQVARGLGLHIQNHSTILVTKQCEV